MRSSGEFGCVRHSSWSRSAHPCRRQVQRATWVGKGGALEPLNPASLHKEKTPGAQLRSCGWQATFQFLYPSSHPPTTWEPLPALMAPGWEPPIPLSQPRHLWKLGWTHTIKTSPLQAAGTLSSGERGAGTGEGCALPFVSNCLCS